MEIPMEIVLVFPSFLNLGISVVHEDSLKKMFCGVFRKDAAMKAT